MEINEVKSILAFVSSTLGFDFHWDDNLGPCENFERFFRALAVFLGGP